MLSDVDCCLAPGPWATSHITWELVSDAGAPACLLNQNLHFDRVPWLLVCSLPLEKHLSSTELRTRFYTLLLGSAVWSHGTSVSFKSWKARLHLRMLHLATEWKQKGGVRLCASIYRHHLATASGHCLQTKWHISPEIAYLPFGTWRSS